MHLVFTVLDALVFHGPCARAVLSATGPDNVGLIFVFDICFRYWMASKFS